MPRLLLSEKGGKKTASFWHTDNKNPHHHSFPVTLYSTSTSFTTEMLIMPNRPESTTFFLMTVTMNKLPDDVGGQKDFVNALLDE